MLAQQQTNPAGMQHPGVGPNQAMVPMQAPNHGQQIGQGPGQGIPSRLSQGVVGPNGPQSAQVMSAMPPGMGVPGRGSAAPQHIPQLQQNQMFPNPQGHVPNPQLMFQLQQQQQQQHNRQAQMNSIPNMQPGMSQPQFPTTMGQTANSRPIGYPAQLPHSFQVEQARQAQLQGRPNQQMIQQMIPNVANHANGVQQGPQGVQGPQGPQGQPPQMRTQQSMQGANEPQNSLSAQQQPQQPPPPPSQQQQQQQQQLHQQAPLQHQHLQGPAQQPSPQPTSQPSQDQQRQQTPRPPAQQQSQAPSQNAIQQPQSHPQLSNNSNAQSAPQPSSHQGTSLQQQQQIHQQQAQNHPTQQAGQQNQLAQTSSGPGQQNSQQQGIAQQLGQPHMTPQQMAQHQQSVHFRQQFLAAQQQQHANYVAAMATNRLTTFIHTLSSFSKSTQDNDLSYWQSFVSEFFSHDGLFRTQLWDSSKDEVKTCEISTLALARYFWVQFNSGVDSMKIIPTGLLHREVPNNTHHIECGQASFVYWFERGSQLVCYGTLKATIGPTFKLEVLELLTTRHEEYLARGHLDKLFATESPNQKTSPKVKQTLAKGKNPLARQPVISRDNLPESPVLDLGITLDVQRYLQLAETVSNMGDLIRFGQQNAELAPREILDRLAEMTKEQNQDQNQVQMLNQNLGQNQNQIQIQNQQLGPQFRVQQFGQNPQQTQFMLPQGLGSMAPMQQQHQHAVWQQQQQQQQAIAMQNPAQNMIMNSYSSPASQGNLSTPNLQMSSPHSRNGPGSKTNSPRPPQRPGGPTTQMASQRSQQGTSSATASSNASPNGNSRKRRPSGTIKPENPDDGVIGVNGTGPKVKASPKVGVKK